MAFLALDLALEVIRAEDATIPIDVEVPASLPLPISRLEEAGGAPTRTSRTVDRLRTVDLELATWAPTKAVAQDHTERILDILLAEPARDTPRTNGVATTISVGEPTWLPDDEWNEGAGGRPMPRYITIITITGHE